MAGTFCGLDRRVKAGKKTKRNHEHDDTMYSYFSSKNRDVSLFKALPAQECQDIKNSYLFFKINFLVLSQFLGLFTVRPTMPTLLC